MSRLLIAALAVSATLVLSQPAAAHTEPNYVAVPAGEPATVSLQPGHGCDGSPTTTVRVRAPLPDAVAGEVEGWTATSTPDGQGHTVLDWTGGVLADDEPGAFPVEFTAPDTPGDLLTFPSIQRCENGEELAWLSGNPEDEYPAPRVLILPAGSEPALTIDDVPADAPGRNKLIEIVDVDNPNAPPTTPAPTATTAAPTTAVPTTAPPSTSTSPVTTTAETTTPSTAAPTTTAASPTTAAPAETSAAPTPTTAADESDSSSTGLIVAGIIVAAVLVAAGAVVLARRRRSISS